MEYIGAIFGAALVLCAVGLVIFTALWVMVDARERGVRGWPVALLVLVLHLPGLLIWLIVRPDRVSRFVPRAVSSGGPPVGAG